LKVVLDTSPISYLLLIGHVEILPVLYDRLFVPSAVAGELGHPEAPLLLRNWVADPPAWLEIHPVGPRPPGDLSPLHQGEREAIFLAEDLGADLIILDDLEARAAAVERGLKMMGLLGVLDRAAAANLIDLPVAVQRLLATNFHVAPWLLKNLLDRHAG
jgi:predicted nucleic acid-binding protein